MDLTTSFAYIPVRNLSKFDRILMIEGFSQPYLFIPKGLFPCGVYGHGDWINRQVAYFFPLDTYLMVTACETPGLEQVQNSLLNSVLPAVYEILKAHPDNLLSPNALRSSDLLPAKNEIERDAVEIHPLLYSADYSKDAFVSAFASHFYPNPEPNGLLFEMGRQQSLGTHFTISDVLETINFGRHRKRNSNAIGVLGSLVFEHIQDCKAGSPLEFLKCLRRERRPLRRWRHFVGFLRDFLSAYRGSGTPKQRGGRYYWELGDFRGVQPRPIDLTDSQTPSVPAGDVFNVKTKYMTVDERNNIAVYVNNILIAIRDGDDATRKRCWNEMLDRYRHKIEMKTLTYSGKTYNQALLSYYLEACSASRPGVRYLNLYQVLEHEMPPPGGGLRYEKDLLESYLSANFTVSDFEPELSATMNYTPPITICGQPSGLVPVQKSMRSIVESIYSVRCMVAHSKSTRVAIKPFSNEEYAVVPAYWDLMAKIAERVIEK